MIKNSKILLALAAILLAGMILTGGFLYRSLGNLVREIREVERRAAILDLDLRNLKVLESFLSGTARERDAIRKGFVGKDNLVLFIEDLEKAGRENGINVSVESASFSVNPNDPGPAFRLDAKGSFSALFRYLLFLENLPYELAFEEIHLNAVSGRKADKWDSAFIVHLLSYEF